MKKPLFSVSPTVLVDEDLPYRVSRGGKQFVRTDTEKKARLITEALNNAEDFKNAPNAASLLVYEQVLALGIQVITPLPDHLPDFLVRQRGKTPEIITGDLLMIGSTSYSKTAVAAFKKAHGVEGLQNVQALLLTVSVEMGHLVETDLTQEEPAKKSKKEGKKSEGNGIKKPKPSTVKAVKKVLHDKQGENWPDPLA